MTDTGTPACPAPRFSIAIPVYNRGDYLRQAIASCLAQTVRDFEVVVSDDCSTENLREIVESYGDPRLSYHRSEQRLGASPNHQRAVSLSRGQYVVTLNSDDMLLPECLERAGDVLERRPEAAAAYFACAYLDGTRVAGASKLPAISFADSVTLLKDPWLLQFHGTGPSVCLFRRDVFNRVGGYRRSLRLAYDWDLYSRFLRVGGGVVFLPEILCIYRLHNEQMVETSSINGLWDMLDLWSEQANDAWPARQLTGLVLAQCIIQLGGPNGIKRIVTMLREIGRRRITWRLLPGIPGALWDRAASRFGFAQKETSARYCSPADGQRAIERAKSLLPVLMSPQTSSAIARSGGAA